MTEDEILVIMDTRFNTKEVKGISDIWNAEMTVLIGQEKAELFATHMKIKILQAMRLIDFLKRHISKWIYIIIKLEEIFEKNIKMLLKIKWQILFIRKYIP